MKKMLYLAIIVLAICVSQPANLFAAATAAAGQEQTLVRVNLNQATLQELQTLPGIGKVTAERILEYRAQKQSFATAEEIMAVKGVGKKTFEKIQNLIYVE
ncbi:hypothetical protein DESUT3_11540 [Desulfuromonas versatilis]|uniref:Helix-hairpin-helix DNA-binding motif class 1 domain-containing protein n=1 Tax=Desulfuromonas versatilis TaxID=2802975 RepID=A0ABM8HSV4_9BACT|nr:helix-hairpin-helix domain-containing protein [Desulfuromonas versatilis]BCR04085.1 hypothetical protein DESUT3_11540 [Desulfuromonas versatilis]